MVKISVLIPVYNASEFLDESISSILNQTFTDIELICVNDGSTDNSLEMLQNFAKEDSRVIVIDKENGGCGSARNRALQEANGDYIYFFDPDDLVENNALELAYNSAVKNNSDLVIFKANIFDKNGISNDQIFFYYNKSLNNTQFDNLTFNDIKRYVLKGGYAPWSKLYKKEFLDSYDDFKFDLGLAFDDVPFHVKSMTRAKRISFINEFLYHYRVDNVNSVNSTSSNGFDIFKIIGIVENIIRDEGLFDELIHEFYTFKLYHILNYIITTDSERYFEMAQEEFRNTDKKYIEKDTNLCKRYDVVIESNNYSEFKLKYDLINFEIEKNYEISKLKEEQKNLKKKNKSLKKKNKKLKQQNNELKQKIDELLNSNSWKLTKMFRRS